MAITDLTSSTPDADGHQSACRDGHHQARSATFRDAKLADLIEQSPCVLDERQLGPLVDKDPEWRNDAVFTREEAETLIADERIPRDRQMVYGLELLAGVRPGEAAALRWRHYDPVIKPLGKLLVAKSYNSRKKREKSTKTDAVKHVPVHPVLAAMLSEWKLGGWAAIVGRSPTADDLIVPLPSKAITRRRAREGEPFRSHDYSGKRWREEDLPALGWRHRRHYDMRATFITLAIEDGVDPEILETRVTHTRKSRNAFHGYNRGLHWARTCAEIVKLQIQRGPRGAATAVSAAMGGVVAPISAELSVAITADIFAAPMGAPVESMAGGAGRVSVSVPVAGNMAALVTAATTANTARSNTSMETASAVAGSMETAAPMASVIAAELNDASMVAAGVLGGMLAPAAPSRATALMAAEVSSAGALNELPAPLAAGALSEIAATAAPIMPVELNGEPMVQGLTPKMQRPGLAALLAAVGPSGRDECEKSWRRRESKDRPGSLQA